MKAKFLTCFFIAVITATSVWSQRAIIKGRINDIINRESLTGATVSIKAGSNSTVTDVNGEFSFYVNPGKLQLNIRYLGYRDTAIDVSIRENELKILSISLFSDYTQLSSVIVTGFLQGQAKALNQQKNADNIRNVISADQIGRFPDPNATEALQRVPGVNIERDQGEGRYVLIRGLAPQFTNISINGEQIPSPEADVRFVALDAIPADQLASIEVSKALTPDMDGDAIGGNLNLITRTAQHETVNVSASGLVGYNRITKKSNLQGSLEIGKRFFNNKLG